MNPNDIQTFSVTFKTTNEAYLYITNWLISYPKDIEVISDKILPDTQELYDNDPFFKKLVKISKDANDAKLDYINKHNK
ncbi:MAG: hypothetical protein GY793_10165 [Proteobacteria bacterium]|nr:hypothetical protein [Pseudomonadota bacterium]